MVKRIPDSTITVGLKTEGVEEMCAAFKKATAAAKEFNAALRTIPWFYRLWWYITDWKKLIKSDNYDLGRSFVHTRTAPTVPPPTGRPPVYPPLPKPLPPPPAPPVQIVPLSESRGCVTVFSSESPIKVERFHMPIVDPFAEVQPGVADLPFERLRSLDSFLILTQLLGNERDAREALAAEGKFVKSLPLFTFPFGLEWARDVRQYLFDHGRDWSQENQLRACIYTKAKWDERRRAKRYEPSEANGDLI